MAKKVAIIGNGNVGSALQKGAERAGYEARATGPDPKEVADAGAWGEIIILAIPTSARQEAIKNLGNIKGKTLVDPTNMLNEDYSFAGDIEKSGAEQVQEWAPDAKVVKAFNTIFAQNMMTGKVNGEALTLFIAGNDAGARKQVADLGKAIGMEPLDVGDLSNARYLEVLGFLNIQLGYGLEYGTNLGFKVVGDTAK